jgi:hypothetical protein
MKGRKGVGGYIGLSRTEGPQGGIFGLKEQTLLQSNNKWLGVDLPTSGLQLYLDANNPTSYPGSGNTWFDLSGNNRNFTWTSTSYNSSGVKSFNTDGRKSTGPASNSFGVTNTSGYTIFMTMTQTQLRTTSSFKWYSSNSSDPASSVSRGIFSHCTWSDANIYWDQGGCCGADTRTSVASGFTLNTWAVVAFRCNHAATSRTIWRNNSVLTTNTSGIANINLSATGADLGGTSESTNWAASIGQFALYNRSLSDAEMTTVYNTLRTKVGI